MLRYCFALLVFLTSVHSSALYVDINASGQHFFANIRLHAEPEIVIEWAKRPPDAAITDEIELLIRKYVERYRQQLSNFRSGPSLEPQQFGGDYELTYQPGFVMHCDYDNMSSH